MSRALLQLPAGRVNPARVRLGPGAWSKWWAAWRGLGLGTGGSGPGLYGLAPGTRAICRREWPHPGAQLSFTDSDGYRFQVFLTNQRGRRIARLEQIHRSRAAVEDSIRCAKASGLRNLPFRAFAHNAVWLKLVLLGCDLVAFTKNLLLDGELATCEPKCLRYRLFHVAGRIVAHARRLTLRLPRSWPWADALVQAFARLQELPAG